MNRIKLSKIESNIESLRIIYNGKSITNILNNNSNENYCYKILFIIFYLNDSRFISFLKEQKKKDIRSFLNDIITNNKLELFTLDQKKFISLLILKLIVTDYFYMINMNNVNHNNLNTKINFLILILRKIGGEEYITNINNLLMEYIYKFENNKKISSLLITKKDYYITFVASKLSRKMEGEIINIKKNNNNFSNLSNNNH